MTGRYDWMADAACAQVDADLWTAGGPGSTYRHARAICHDCPVKRQCEAHREHLSVQPDIQLHGMWAEQTPRQRPANPDTERAAA